MPGAGEHAEACNLKAQRDEDGRDEQRDVGELLNACDKSENQVLKPDLQRQGIHMPPKETLYPQETVLP